MEAAAYKRLYPHEYYEKFISQETRPDGRPLGRGRPVSVARGVVGTSDGSCLVKIGRTTCLAAVNLELGVPELESPNQGTLEVTVELPPMCSSETRPGRHNEEAAYVTGRVRDVLTDGKVVDLRSLSIEPAKHCWKVFVDVYVLDHDGTILDAALLAANGALRDCVLPVVSIDERGDVEVLYGQAVSGLSAEGDADEIPKSKKVKPGEKTVGLNRQKRLVPASTPLSCTCALYKNTILVDPSHEEEKLSETSVTVCVDELGKIVGVFKPGGRNEASETVLANCVAASRLRYAALSKALKEAFA